MDLTLVRLIAARKSSFDRSLSRTVSQKWKWKWEEGIFVSSIGQCSEERGGQITFSWHFVALWFKPQMLVCDEVQSLTRNLYNANHSYVYYTNENSQLFIVSLEEYSWLFFEPLCSKGNQWKWDMHVVSILFFDQSVLPRVKTPLRHIGKVMLDKSESIESLLYCVVLSPLLVVNRCIFVRIHNAKKRIRVSLIGRHPLGSLGILFLIQYCWILPY